jgi:histidine racemase
MSRIIHYSKVIPGGNTTILVYDRLPRKHHAAIAKSLMSLHPDCEQVGFIEPSEDPKAVCRLQMMGGEFCGNASRSLVWLIATMYFGEQSTIPLAEIKKSLFNFSAAKALPNCSTYIDVEIKRASLPIEVSGYEGILSARACYNTSTAAVQNVIVPMPIRTSPDSIVRTTITREWSMPVDIVHLDGISHVLVEESVFRGIGGSDDLMLEARRILSDLELMQQEAAGVIFHNLLDDVVSIKPVVYVRETDTLIPETACGSGTVALVQYLAKESQHEVLMPVKQPTGLTIMAKVSIVDGVFQGATIAGDVQIVEEGEMAFTDFNLAKNVIIRQIKTVDEFSTYQDQLGALYAKIFADPPYYERFTVEEAISELHRTVEAVDGLFFIALDGEEVVGFGGSLPLSNFPEICQVLIDKKVVPDLASCSSYYYMSELGVDYAYRGEGLSHRLVDARLEKIPSQYDTVIVRTSISNNPTQHLYADCRGFNVLPGVYQQVVNRKFYPDADEPVMEPDERLFLVLDRTSVMANLTVKEAVR